MTNTSYHDRYLSLFKETGSEQKAATRLEEQVRREAPDLWEAINKKVNETKFSVRGYGRGQFYCWASHSDLPPLDPWPAARYPRAVLFADFVRTAQPRREASPAGERAHHEAEERKEWPFEVADTAFAAVRFEHPRIPGEHIWRLKIVETGQILDPGTGGISNESRPKMVQDLEYLLERISKGNTADFRKRWGLPEFPPRVRFNWGFHDGSADAERGRDPQWKPEAHHDAVYVAGYYGGRDAYRHHGVRPESSDEGWAIYALGEWSGRIQPFIVQTEGVGDAMELKGASVPEDQLAHLLAQPGVIYARNQDGAMVELSTDMDFETPVVRAVDMTPTGPKYLTDAAVASIDDEPSEGMSP